MTHYLAILSLACCPSMQACSGNSNPPPAVSVPKEASHPQTCIAKPQARIAEIVQKEATQKEETAQKETHIIIKNAAVAEMPKKQINRVFNISPDSIQTVESTTPGTQIESGRSTKECSALSAGTERTIETELSTETKQAIETNKTTNKAKAPQRYIAVKTNLAYRAIAVNNLAIEVACSKHLSIELPLMWSLWDVNKDHSLRTFTVQPEVRWWVTETGQGHFFGVHTHVGWFNAKWNNDRYQDTGRPLLGAGLSYGYCLPFSRHWGAEFTLGAGYANMKYDTYYNIDNGALISTGDSKNYWGITRIGLSLVYRF